MRLAAIHAIELYLNALLLSRGHASSEVRGLQHDLEKRMDLTLSCGKKLRAKTTDHLKAMGHTVSI